jgi:hypothetical protein
MRYWQQAVLFFLALVAGGCGSKGYPISGKVTLDGEPIADGLIVFAPKSGSGPEGSGKIVNGQYSANVPSGECKVQITASKLMKLPDGQKGMYGKTEEVRGYVPPAFNSDTNLTADITGPKGDLDFILKSPATPLDKGTGRPVYK